MKNSRSVFIFYFAIGLVAGVFVLAPALYIQSKLDPAPGHWPAAALARQNANAHCQETQNTNEELKMKN